jgi:hypothetical protein
LILFYSRELNLSLPSLGDSVEQVELLEVIGEDLAEVIHRNISRDTPEPPG